MASFRGISAGTIGAAGVGAVGYGAYKFNQDGYIDKTKGVGAGALGIGLGIGAIKIARGGASPDMRRQIATSAMRKAASAGSFRTKVGVGLFAGAVGLGTKAGYEAYNQGDYGNATKYAAGATLVGAVGMKAFTSGRGATAKAGAIGQALENSDNFAAKAASMKNLGRYGIAGVAAGGLTMAAGIQQRDAKEFAVGAGLAAIGGIAVQQGYSRSAKNLERSEKALDKAVKIATQAKKKGIGFGGRSRSINVGSGVVRSSGIATGGLLRETERAVAESVTHLRGPKISRLGQFFSATKGMGPFG